MRTFMLAIASASCLTLAACGGHGDDKLGDEARQAMDNKADAMDAAADNMTGAAEEVTEARADAMRDAGEAKEEAIDDSDVDARQLTNGQKAEIVKPD